MQWGPAGVWTVCAFSECGGERDRGRRVREMHEGMTLEELKEAIKEKAEEAQKLYDVAYDLLVVSMELYGT
jgi:hypothetical protein